ncbi:hypothetical protein RUM44_010651 [Polyplax serrata]|uniref:Uncharacterized protein n=1 Tax=Polyplax serrata TaxID=468196 RepID=A0ABR1AMT2_POLSC
MSVKSRISTAAICLVLIGAFLIEEVESRRVILIGRKAITRTYYKKPLIPAWATVTLVGIFMLVLGGGIYFLLNKIILGDIIRGPKFARVSKSEVEV